MNQPVNMRTLRLKAAVRKSRRIDRELDALGENPSREQALDVVRRYEEFFDELRELFPELFRRGI